MKIVLKDISKSFQDGDTKTTIFSNINGDFLPGKSHAIVGASGIGKSTLLYLIAGLDRPSGGSVHFSGKEETVISDLDVEQRAEFRKNNVGFVFQGHHLLPEFTALDNVLMPYLVKGIKNRETREKAEKVLIKVGLKDRMNFLPGKLSGGEQQRVGLARAVITEPEVLLADEPTGSLDSRTGEEVRNLLVELQKELGSTLIVVTHNQQLANSLDVKFTLKNDRLIYE